ncbi:hypothetical protein A1Q1_03380 [Trichosporon asahii var. asahii CBS 2479]|uniref:Uncharacterized protein n=1 Tax=Trichosporon asahii var. asahii (strain ATCC 90039 / CBS 2479 / JCM 2466 / KCTC 7840 / NBRC 103889/ NCYC 2677 / UAMH 7654) TaxID=1186058 RepID=J5RGX6_TRIAS|nr:hypothetical protein A1Q1_03380 [Trichosporon asahii var. asahii CBS 2479]EJT52578.1 hypothetical protein A1Q1_03380 [Trichosporon asahii var. asahii CBS 2479]
MSNNQTVSDVVLGTAWTVTPGVIASTAVGAHARSTVLHRALYSFASAGIGATSTFSFDLSDPDTLENTLQLCFFLAGGVVLMPTLNSYYGHGIRFDIDFLEKGIFVICLVLYICSRIAAMAASYVLYKHHGHMETKEDRERFQDRASRALLPVTLFLWAYPFFGVLPGMTAQEAKQAVVEYVCPSPQS